MPLTVTEDENGKYRVSYSPEYEGPWKISIKIQDRELPRSPFYVAMSKACERDYTHVKPKSEISKLLIDMGAFIVVTHETKQS